MTSLNSTATAADLALNAPIASPTFTGTVLGITKAIVDLDNVDNTSDALKPVPATTTQLNLRTDKTATDTSAVAWSAGLTSGAYHYITTGTDSLVIKTATNIVSANFFGDNAGTLKGQALFYKDVEVMGSLINNGTNLLTLLN